MQEQTYTACAVKAGHLFKLPEPAPGSADAPVTCTRRGELALEESQQSGTGNTRTQRQERTPRRSGRREQVTDDTAHAGAVDG